MKHKITLTRAELNEQSPIISTPLPDIESTAPYWPGSVGAELDALRCRIRELETCCALLESELLELKNRSKLA
jgi:hypothetical protein